MVFVKTHDISELNEELIGKSVVLGGWIEDLRKLGKMSFITLRDVSGISQVIVKGELNDNLGEINRQSVVSVKGTVQETKARDFAFEIKADEIEVLGKAIHPLPIEVDWKATLTQD
jgi:aspartyl-tRNA synthetase